MVRYQPPMDWQEWSELVGGGTAWSQSLAVAAAVAGHPVCQRTAHRDHLAPGRGDSRRLRRLLLLPAALGRKTKSVATRLLSCCCCGCCRSRAVGDRRHADQALRAEGRRGRHPSQSHARSGRPEVSLWTHLGDDLAGPAASAVATIGLPLVGLLYVRAQEIATIPKKRGWKFRTKLELAARQV